MDLKVAHDFLRFFLNKEQGGWFSPEELDVLLHRAQMWLFNELSDAYAINQKLHDSLGIFRKKSTFTTASDGILNSPTTGADKLQLFLAGYVQYFDNALSKTRQKSFRLLNEDEIADRLNSQILAPSATDPAAEQLEPGKIQLHPATVYAGYYFYLKVPQPPVFVYTLTGTTINYNQGSSTQMVWDEGSMLKILIKAAQLAGVNLSAEDIKQYTELKDTQRV